MGRSVTRGGAEEIYSRKNINQDKEGIYRHWAEKIMCVEHIVIVMVEWKFQGNVSAEKKRREYSEAVLEKTRKETSVSLDPLQWPRPEDAYVRSVMLLVSGQVV